MLNREHEVANLALDFMNPESRRIAGVYRNFPPQAHRTILERLLNLYVLWCAEFCILPPGVLSECAIADSAMQQKISFLRERLIRVPMSDMNLAHFLAERRYEYRSHKSYFPDLFLDRNTALTEAPEAIVAKLLRTGESIAGAWERLPERLETSILPKWVNASASQAVARIAKLPGKMIHRGETLTWPDVRRELRSLPIAVEPTEPRRWLQHLYLETYNGSFNLKTIRNLPAQLPELGYLEGGLAYDYDAIKAVFDLWGLFRKVVGLPAHQIIRLRNGPGFVRFRIAFEKAACITGSIVELKGQFAVASTRVLVNTRHGFSRRLFHANTYSQIEDELDAFFNEIAEAVEAADERQDAAVGSPTMLGKFKGITTPLEPVPKAVALPRSKPVTTISRQSSETASPGNAESSKIDEGKVGPLNVFISYSHQDEKMRVKMGQHLAPLVSDGFIRIWHDREIEAGADWEGEINREIGAADIILLLVSASFLNSRYCRKELLRAIEQRGAGKSLPIPIILRPCDWASVFNRPEFKTQALPRDDQPVAGGRWRNQDAAFAAVAKELRAKIERMRSSS